MLTTEKLQETNPEALYHEMMNYPYDKDDVSGYRYNILTLLSQDEKYDEFVLCFNSGITGTPMGEEYKKVFNVVGAQATRNGVLHELVSFPEKFGDELFIKQRRFVEYNIAFKQLCVSVAIKHGDKFVLLENTENHRLANKVTMIQGHVDYSTELYRKTMLDYLKRTVIKEINEEISGLEVFGDELHNMLIDRVIMNDKFGDSTSLEHIGVIFTLHLPETFDITKITTKEPEKHQVKIYDKDSVGKINTLDRWLELSLPYLV